MNTGCGGVSWNELGTPRGMYSWLPPSTARANAYVVRAEVLLLASCQCRNALRIDVTCVGAHIVLSLQTALSCKKFY